MGLEGSLEGLGLLKRWLLVEIPDSYPPLMTILYPRMSQLLTWLKVVISILLVRVEIRITHTI